MKTKIAVMGVCAAAVWICCARAAEPTVLQPPQSTPAASTSSAPAKPAQTQPALSSGVADLLKLAEHGVSAPVLKAYVENYPIAFHPSATEIVRLHEAGISSDVITALLKRSGELSAKSAAVTPPGAAQPTFITPQIMNPQPEQQVVVPAQPSVNYVYPSYTYPVYSSYPYTYWWCNNYSSWPLYSSYGNWQSPYVYRSQWPRWSSWPAWTSWPSHPGYGTRPSFNHGNHWQQPGVGQRPVFSQPTPIAQRPVAPPRMAGGSSPGMGIGNRTGPGPRGGRH